MTAGIFSLVLASATGWALLAFGYLPVSQVKQHGGEPLKAVAAWVVVAATAAPGIFHWYLIFAVICLVAWTKLERPAGKIWLAVAAALSLTLGIVFPLELSPELLGRENILMLGSLYLGGGVTGVAYMLCVVCGRAPADGWRPPGFARGWLALAVAWSAVLGLILWRAHRLAAVSPENELSTGETGYALAAIVLGLAFALIALAFLAMAAVRRDRLRQARWLGGMGAVLAFGESLIVQLLFP